ncbi:cell division protein FtsW, lipid II flippase [Paenibacillus sophorae]|uniref:Cell division protein FtsW, lipid II flippase n=1 Tax=Paenibacillus sophorae TaxID=1333845 RepID=A0A1H8FLY1_9BACL|nr:FtsW/RodA/SpoVE family cell cycle protein [Paenibacillus sophorae]QWU13913.1 FtsW/RodA/SpoVE family cell cycle protein [Paenibacillus sophorae]SEN32625.1 cell division protein FtsW, lipid II flippase [Paenibacillus sophorae]
MGNTDKFNVYLDKVCEQVRARELHGELRMELANHLEELASEREAMGFGKEEAVKWALEQMGEPETVGRSLHHVHKPRMNWKLLAVVLLFGAIGLSGMLSLSAAKGNTGTNELYERLAYNHIHYLIMGIVLMLGLAFFDYRKLRRYSWALYTITLTGMTSVFLSDINIHGVKGWIFIAGFGINVIGLSPYTLLIALAGVWTPDWNLYTGAYRLKKRLALPMIVVPCLFYVFGRALAELVIFLAVSLMVYVWLNGGWRRSIIVVSGTVTAVLMYVWQVPVYRIGMMAAIDPDKVSRKASYLILNLRETMASAGWLGHGFGSLRDQLPYVYSEMLFPYLIYTFGYLAGLVLAGMIVWFIAQAVLAWRSIHDHYGKTLFAGIMLLLILPFVYELLMLTGYVFILDLPLPFLSYGGSHLLAEFAALGLLLSIYRRKDTLPRAANDSRVRSARAR